MFDRVARRAVRFGAKPLICHLESELLLIAAGGVAQLFGRLAWIEQRVGERPAILHTEPDDLALLKRAHGSLVGAGDEEIGQGAPLKLCRALEKSLLIARQPGFQPLASSARNRFLACA